MSDLIVIMGASCVHGTMELYHQQLRDAGIDYHVEDVSHLVANWGGGCLQMRIDGQRMFSRRFAHYEKMIISDAFDVTFYGTKEDVMSKIPDTGWLQAAEKNCYPDISIASRIEGSTPWRFFNGGLSAGTPQAFLEWCDAVERDPAFTPYSLDQQYMNLRLADKSPIANIDSQTNLFYCLFGGYSELEFVNGLPVNTLCGTHPNFIHANGKWDASEAFRKRELSLV